MRICQNTRLFSLKPPNLQLYRQFSSVTMDAPYISPDPQKVSQMIAALDASRKEKRKSGFAVKKTSFDVKGSRDGIHVDSWRMQDWEYKRRDLPTYARGLFTTKSRANGPQIAVRGYDKFFNVDEVHETKWDNIISRTQPPYELTLKENGCIIFISGLEDDTLLVCSKHSTGGRSDVEVSHASAGETRIERQLAAIGKTKSDLARELYSRNATAVAELCDDSFEEHILPYTPDKAGLYLHGINLNVPEFATYPSPFVQDFARDWGFRKTGLIVMDDINQVKAFLEEVAESGAHDGRDVEGFVIRCKMTHDPAAQPYRDWFFKYKFEEPYLMYRQWRECTKALIAGKQPKIRKHAAITEDYLLYARRRLAADPNLGKEYNHNHGIIALRNDFLDFKNLKGADAANMEDNSPVVRTEVQKDVILCPIATIGCGKTTVALGLTHLFGWGHVQNDNISGKGRPPRFVRAILDQLQSHPVVFADRNNAQRHERRQIITDVKTQHASALIVCLNFRHDEGDIEAIRHTTQERVLKRGDNHQTIHAATDQEKFIGVMEGFIKRYEACNSMVRPDDGFDLVIDLDPVAGSRKNMETTVTELHRNFPNLIKEIPSSEKFDMALEASLGYKPETFHDIPDRSKKGAPKENRQQQQQQQKKPKKQQLEYLSVAVPEAEVNAALSTAFHAVDVETSRFYKQLKQTRRVQAKYHVTLMHRATAKEYPSLWERYTGLHAQAVTEGVENGNLGECDVMLERVSSTCAPTTLCGYLTDPVQAVFDDRIMAIVVRLIGGQGSWECVNRVAHITVGTRDDSVKPKESNDLLARWLDDGGSEAGSKIQEVALDGRPTLKGTVKAVLSR